MDLTKLLPDMERNLRVQILAPFYPRSVDNTNGGFHQNYAEDWTPLPDQGRSIVYQARLTWLAAQCVRRFPEERDTWAAHTRHGVDYLAKGIRDPDNGAWFWQVDLSGKPATYMKGEKHAYGIAF